MPKLGRRSEHSNLENFFKTTTMTTSQAPFGTLDTPNIRAKIVGGKTVYVVDNQSGRTSGADTGRTSRDPQTGRDSINRQANNSPSRFGGVTEKPNHINPANSDPSHPESPYHTQDDTPYKSGSRLGSPSHNQPLNPHQVIPPIRSTSTQKDPKYQQPNTYNDQPDFDFKKYLPSDNYLPKVAITLEKKDELYLRRLLHDALYGFDPNRLKNLYLELTGFDRHLKGEITFQDLSFTLMRAKMHVPADMLRVVAAMFVSQPGFVLYEKVLSFLASSIPSPPPTPQSELDNHQTSGAGHHEQSSILSPRLRDNQYNPLTHEDGDSSSLGVYTDPDSHSSCSLSSSRASSAASLRFPFGERDNAKLLRLVQQQLAMAGENLDLSRVLQTFQEADRSCRGVFSRDQIKGLSNRCGIPLQESLTNQIIDRCDCSNGQYNWQQYLAFIERVQPHETGLRIPTSKQPREYAKHYPSPGADWPKVNNDPVGDVDGNQNRGGRNTTAGMTSRQLGGRIPFEAGASNDPNNPLSFGGQSQRQESGWPQEGERVRSPGIDPNDDLPLSHPRMEKLTQIQATLQRQKDIDRLEEELAHLQEQHEVQKKKIEEDVTRREKEEEPWLDRFMKLAGAMYSQDAANAGYLPRTEAIWLTNQYNTMYNLNIPQGEIDKSLQLSTEGERISIDGCLRHLSMQGD